MILLTRIQDFEIESITKYQNTIQFGIISHLFITYPKAHALQILQYLFKKPQQTFDQQLIKKNILPKSHQIYQQFSTQTDQFFHKLKIIQKQAKWRQKYWRLKDPNYIKTIKDDIMVTFSLLKSQRDYKKGKMHLVELIKLCSILKQGRAYHDQVTDEVDNCIYLIAERFIKLFCDFDLHHENIVNQRQQSFQIVPIGQLFRLLVEFKLAVPLPLLKIYLNSYIHIVKDNNLIQFTNNYEIFAQIKRKAFNQNKHTASENLLLKEIREVCELIEITKRKWIDLYVQKVTKDIRVLNYFEINFYLAYIKAFGLNDLSQSKALEICQILHLYSSSSVLLTQNPKYDQIQFENILYCNYFVFKLTQQYLNEYIQRSQLYDRFTQQITKMISKNSEAFFELQSHEPRISCLKLDLLVKLNSLTTNEYFSSSSLLTQLQNLNCIYWQFKYIAWALDSAIQIMKFKSEGNEYYPSIKHLFDFLLKMNLQHSNQIFLTLNLANQAYNQYKITLEIVELNHKIRDWLCSANKQNLKSQQPADICTVFDYANSHPTLIAIYKPFLVKILQYSLGEFQWQQLNKIYYYGLLWKIGLSDEYNLEQAQCIKDNIEYVRRYILNEYASMGINRRQISTESFFYKILKISDSESFYKNYFMRS